MSSAFPPAKSRPLRVRPVQQDTVACKVCEEDAPLFGVHDFNRCCEEARGTVLPPCGVAVYYRRCATCGLLFTDAFDDWSAEDFAAHIYNDQYGHVDWDFEEVRPRGNAGLISRSFPDAKDVLDILDYGGGNGRFAQEMRRLGYGTIQTYDGFHPDHRERPDRTFNLVTCFETIEHMPDPVGGARDIASFLSEDGLLILSTLVQPEDILKERMGWWYIGPRNGHITIFTRRSLEILWGRLSLRVFPTGKPHIHLICKTPPPFAAHILGGG